MIENLSKVPSSVLRDTVCVEVEQAVRDRLKMKSATKTFDFHQVHILLGTRDACKLLTAVGLSDLAQEVADGWLANCGEFTADVVGMDGISARADPQFETRDKFIRRRVAEIMAGH